MASRARSAAPAALVVVVAALAVCGGLAASWVDQSVTRTIGDATVSDHRATTGLELVPLGIVAGLITLAGGVALLTTGEALLRVVALLTAGAAAGALVASVLGVARARALEGAVTAAPWVAGAASLAALAGAIAAFGRPRKRLPARYDVAVPPGDAEWQQASEPGDGDDDDPTGARNGAS